MIIKTEIKTNFFIIRDYYNDELNKHHWCYYKGSFYYAIGGPASYYAIVTSPSIDFEEWQLLVSLS